MPETLEYPRKLKKFRRTTIWAKMHEVAVTLYANG